MFSGDRRESNVSIVRPMSRADIFYSGSIRQISEQGVDMETVGLRTNKQSFVSLSSSNSMVIPRNSLMVDPPIATVSILHNMKK